MKNFDLEIRKAGSFPALFENVDQVLAKHGMVSGQVSIKAAIQTVEHSLNHMLKNMSYFCVTTIRSCAESAAIHISSPRMAIYSAAHCVRWGDMTADYKEMLIAMVMDDFRSLFEEKSNFSKKA